MELMLSAIRPETYELIRRYSISEMMLETTRMTAMALRLSVSLAASDKRQVASRFLILPKNIIALYINLQS